MNTSSIYIRTDPKTKSEAQKMARELGISLSSLINALLIQLIKTKGVILSPKGMSKNQLDEIVRIARDREKRR